MRKGILLVLLLSSFLLFFLACKKWKDPAAVTDPRLTNPYCNDPNAVNYNRGFPGKPDSAICIFPSGLFFGRYVFNDSIFLPDNTFVAFRMDTLMIYALSETKLGVLGLCRNGDSLRLTASATYIATVDTSNLLLTGQGFCGVGDTATGTFTKDLFDTTIIHINLLVASDTGVNVHTGTAKKQF